MDYSLISSIDPITTYKSTKDIDDIYNDDDYR
jgi:hypothetical protein